MLCRKFFITAFSRAKRAAGLFYCFKLRSTLNTDRCNQHTAITETSSYSDDIDELYRAAIVIRKVTKKHGIIDGLVFIKPCKENNWCYTLYMYYPNLKRMAMENIGVDVIP